MHGYQGEPKSIVGTKQRGGVKVRCLRVLGPCSREGERLVCSRKIAVAVGCITGVGGTPRGRAGRLGADPGGCRASGARPSPGGSGRQAAGRRFARGPLLPRACLSACTAQATWRELLKAGVTASSVSRRTTFADPLVPRSGERLPPWGLAYRAPPPDDRRRPHQPLVRNRARTRPLSQSLLSPRQLLPVIVLVIVRGTDAACADQPQLLGRYLTFMMHG